jgi:hypothetical protein
VRYVAEQKRVLICFAVWQGTGRLWVNGSGFLGGTSSWPPPATERRRAGFPGKHPWASTAWRVSWAGAHIRVRLCHALDPAMGLAAKARHSSRSPLVGPLITLARPGACLDWVKIDRGSAPRQLFERASRSNQIDHLSPEPRRTAVLNSSRFLNIRRICARAGLLYRPHVSYASGRVASARGSSRREFACRAASYFC